MESYFKFEKGDDTIYHGDAITVLRDTIPDQSVNLIFADPPYNIGKKFSHFHDKWNSDEEYAEWCYIWIDLCVEKLIPSGSLYIMTSTQAMPFIDIYLRKKLHILSRIVWHYDSSGVQAKHYFGSLYEPILHCVKDRKNYTFNSEDILVEAKTGSQRKLIDYRKPEPTPYNTKKVPGNAWYFPRVRYRMDEYENHPSQKPEALIERIVRASSNEGDVILDPFSGTFTTSRVGQRLHRKTIGIESQEEYVKIGLRRLNILEMYNEQSLQPSQKSFTRRNNPADIQINFLEE